MARTTCREFTKNDLSLFDQYMEIFRQGNIAMSIECGLPQTHAQEMSRLAGQLIAMHLERPGNTRYHVHFTDGMMDGQLFETCNNLTVNGKVVPALSIEWMTSMSSRQGVGTDLMRDFVYRAEMEDKKALSLAVYDSNKRAIDFFSKHGFKPYRNLSTNHRGLNFKITEMRRILD